MVYTLKLYVELCRITLDVLNIETKQISSRMAASSRKFLIIETSKGIFITIITFCYSNSDYGFDVLKCRCDAGVIRWKSTG